MLEEWIIRTYRRARDARRERRAARFDQEARTYDVVGQAYRVSLMLLEGFEANTAAKLLARRGGEKYEKAAREARRHAADIRAGRRFRRTRAELYNISDEAAAADEAADGPR